MPAARTLPYFAANAGATELAGVTAAANGMDVKPLPAGQLFSTSILAARVARGCGHALGLGDEYGNGELAAGPVVTGFNLQPQDTAIVTSPPAAAPRVIDATQPWSDRPRDGMRVALVWDASAALASRCSHPR
jgi:hypothetical protein